MEIKQHIPNAITCGNLLCGCIAIISCLNGNLIQASYLIGLAAVLDFLDGFVARLLNVHSDIGKQLDSLADMVTFGVTPGIIIYQLLGQVCTAEGCYTPWIALIIPVYSALRLAKFNIDTRQTDSFIGVPTPANTMLIASFPLIINQNPIAGEIILNRYFLVGVTAVMSYLLVAELPLFALKFKKFNWKGNQIRYIFLAGAVLLLIIFQFIAIPLIILLYVILSVIQNITGKNQVTTNHSSEKI